MLEEILKLAQEGNWQAVINMLEGVNGISDLEAHKIRKMCPKYEGCSAPLCPLDVNSLQNIIWYPDEEICKFKPFGGLLFIRNQRKIANKTGDVTKYFTYDMLNRKFIIKKGITGLDPDKEERLQLKKWFKSHPEQKEISSKEKEELRKRMAKIRPIRSTK